jgi:peptide/nickel transport system permease protein
VTPRGRATQKVGAAFLSALVAGLLTLTLIFFIEDSARHWSVDNLPQKLTRTEQQQLISALGLDHSLLQRWADFMSRSVRLDFGLSFSTAGSTRALVALHAWPSILLLGTGILFAIGLARFSAMATLRKPWGRHDKTLTSAALGVGAIPFHFPAVVALLVFAATIHWFPVSGYAGDQAATGAAHFVDVARHLFLPALCLGLVLWGTYHVWFRTLAFEALTASGKKPSSLKGRRRAAREAWEPFLRLVVMSLGYGVVGLFLVEPFFSYPGIGKLFFASLGTADAPTLFGILVAVCVPLAMTASVARSWRRHPVSLDSSQVQDRPDPRRRQALTAGVAILGTYLLVVFGGTLLTGSDQTDDILASKNDQPILAAPGWRCPQSYTDMAPKPGTSQVELVQKPCPSSERRYYLLGTDGAGVSVLAEVLWDARWSTLGVGVILLVALGLTALLRQLSGIGGPRVSGAAAWLADWTTSLPAALIVAVAAWFTLTSTIAFLILLGCLLWGGIGREALLPAGRRIVRLRFLASMATLAAFAFFTLSAVDVLLSRGVFSDAQASGATTGGEWWWWGSAMIATIIPILGARLIAFGLTPAPQLVEAEPDEPMAVEPSAVPA